MHAASTNCISATRSAGSRMLRDFLNREGVSIGRRYVASLDEAHRDSAASSIALRTT